MGRFRIALMAKTVLIADDTAFVRDRFGAALAEAGHDALLSGSAADVLARLRATQSDLDLVVLDLHLPGAKGVALVRAIRDAGCRAPILVFSGTIANAEEVRELASLGVSAFINEYTAPPHILPALAPHLFPDSFNRRSSPRVALSVTVSMRVDHVIASAVSSNVSKGGVFLRTMTPLPVGKRLRVRFRLPCGGEIDGEATVAWSDARCGMGLQFVTIGPEGQTALDQFVDRTFFSNRKA
jgi:uncharacterized protein (TIGR02266 family)